MALKVYKKVVKKYQTLRKFTRYDEKLLQIEKSRRTKFDGNYFFSVLQCEFCSETYYLDHGFGTLAIMNPGKGVCIACLS